MDICCKSDIGYDILTQKNNLKKSTFFAESMQTYCMG